MPASPAASGAHASHRLTSLDLISGHCSTLSLSAVNSKRVCQSGNVGGNVPFNNVNLGILGKD